LLHKRRHHRVKRRFACEFLAEGKRYRGIIVELSRGGLFVQTDATTAPGSEIELHVAAAGAVPDLLIRGVVVRRRMVPAPLASAMRRGIALEILEAPREYGLACGSDLLDAPIRLSRRSGDAAGGGTGAAEPTPERAPGAADPGGVRHAVPPLAGPPAAPAGPAPDPGEAGAALRPAAVLVDDGSLGDVEAALRELGVETQHVHCSGSGQATPVFQVPAKLFVTTARLACSLYLPAPSEDERLVAIAVAEAGSQTLSSMMRRLGFHYVVRRPTHPEALRLLLRRVLYRGVEHRRTERFPFGSEVAWRTGWKRRRAAMVELSATGCRLHAAHGAELGAPIRIWIPAEATGDRRIVLRGRIARRDPQSRAGLAEGFSLAVTFDARRSARMQRRLEALLETSRRGPATLPRSAASARSATAPGLEPTAATAPPAPPTAPAPPSPEPSAAPETPRAPDAGATQETAAPTPERRGLPRARLEREIVTLDASGSRAVHALVGRDLSPGGMRVDPHPELALHQRLRLALYEPSVARPVVVDAEVMRDDGEAGLALRFVDLDPGVAEEIACILATLPSLESLRLDPGRIVLGELLREQPAA
jgi:hypothetical protein